MVSLFYSSNEKKQRKYIKDRRLEEENQANQQEIVDDQIDRELGLDIAATKTSLLSKRVANKLASFTPMASADDNTLINAINNGKLSELFDKIKLLSDSSLTKTQQNIRDNLKNPNTKQIINELIAEAIPNGPEAIKQVIISNLGDEDSVLKLISKASKINLKDFTGYNPPVSKKSIIRENELMGNEDINYAVKPISSKPASAAQIEAQKKAQANLDLISLFQQDVKESRKKQSLRDLAQLSVDEDLRLRRNFMKVLEDIKDTAEKEKSKAQYKEDKKILDKMMELIKNQRMHDSYLEFARTAQFHAYADKIKKNLKAYLNYNKSLELINSYTGKNKRSNSDNTTTSQSTEPPRIDLRAYNKGAPKKDTNVELNELSDLLKKFEQSSGGERQILNRKINNIIKRQEKVNPLIANRMKLIKSSLMRG